jgi:hypothetical protein
MSKTPAATTYTTSPLVSAFEPGTTTTAIVMDRTQWTGAYAMILSCPATTPVMTGVIEQFGDGATRTLSRSWGLQCAALPNGVALSTAVKDISWSTPALTTGTPTAPSKYTCAANQVLTGISVSHISNQGALNQEYTSVQCTALATGTSAPSTNTLSITSGDQTSATGALTSCPTGFYSNGFTRGFDASNPLIAQEKLGMQCTKVTAPTSLITTILIVGGIVAVVILLVFIVVKLRRSNS